MFGKPNNRENTQCEICKVQFNLLKLQRQHICKRCQKHICSKCANYKQKVLDQDAKWTKQRQKVCHLCNSELLKIHNLIKDKNVAWGNDSKLANDWIMRMQKFFKFRNQALPGRKATKHKNFEYHHFLRLFYSSPEQFKEDLQMIQKDVINGRTDYSVFNYSMREFFFMVQENDPLYSQQKSRLNIANVLYAVAARFDKIGYVQGMSSIAAFLLCFCSEESAYTIFCDLIENILPEKFLEKGDYGVNLIGLAAHTHFLKEYFIHFLEKVKMPLISHERDGYQKQELQQARLIVQLSSAKALLTLFVAFISFGNLEFIWSQLSVLRSFEVFERAFLGTLYLKRQQIVVHRSFKEIQNIFENINCEEFIEAFYDVQIDQQIKKLMIEQYYENLTAKFNDKSQQSKELQRITSFSHKQIKILQDNFLTKKLGLLENQAIQKKDFIKLIQCYYDILKQTQQEEAPILQMKSQVAGKIFDNFVSSKENIRNSSLKIQRQSSEVRESSRTSNGGLSKKSSLQYKDFVCCLSVCTKSAIKQKMCAILKTFSDKNGKISLFNFSKQINFLCEISLPESENKKKDFLQRINRYFQNLEDGITINQPYFLLNDIYINQLSFYIRSDAPAIISKTIEKYLKLKQNMKEDNSHK